jgi:ribonuclease P protein component
MEHIRKRKDFLAAARAPSQARASLVVQVRDRGDDHPARLGLTTTKKLGNAVRRNRIRRRLRAAARAALEARALPGHDYVLIGRATTAETSFQMLVADLGKAVDKLQRAAHMNEPGTIAAASRHQHDNHRTAANGAKP